MPDKCQVSPDQVVHRNCQPHGAMGHGPWHGLHGCMDTVWLFWLIEDNGSGAVERPARGSMMPPAVACMSYSTVMLVLYPYLDPMDGQMPGLSYISTQCTHHSLLQQSVGPDQSEPQALGHPIY